MSCESRYRDADWQVSRVHKNVTSRTAVVLIVDDDAAIREALSKLIESAGLRAIAFASLQSLLADNAALQSPGCLIMDVRMPGMSGLNFQHYLVTTGNPKTVIFLTAHGDIPMAVQAIKAGAVDFFAKPVRDQVLLDAVIAAIALDARRRSEAAIIRRNTERVESLTPREREVLHEVAHGRVNKQIAFDLGIAEVTVKLHRGNVMRKMEVCSLGELIRAWETLPSPIRASMRSREIGTVQRFVEKPQLSDEIEPDKLDARLPFRWLQGETGKSPAFVISATSD